MSLDVDLIVVKPACGRCGRDEERDVVFEANITHNLNTMAEAAGIYKHLWRPEEIGITTAKELIEPVSKGLDDMRERPDYYKQFNSPNGWGLYKHFVPWIEKYLQACIDYPNSLVEVSR